jgi:RNA polymerase sigma-70 factor (ECF subfamily)
VPQAFTELYEQLAPVAFNLACRILRDAAEAEDVLQQAFLSLWQHVDEYDADKGRISTWFYAFVRNRSIDRLRRRKRENVVELNPETDAPGMPFENGVDDRERRVRVAEAMSALPEAQRLVIEIAYFEGCTQQEIAEKLNEPLGTIKTRMRLGMMKLAERLKNEAPV